MRWAARADANQAEIVKALRDAGAVVWHIKWPVDLIVGFQGRTILMEIKRPKGGKYTDDQKSFLSTWTGGTVATVRDVEGALRAIGVSELERANGA